jgi:hypothetical protein
VMQIIHRGISTYIVNKAEFTNKQAKTGAVTLMWTPPCQHQYC